MTLLVGQPISRVDGPLKVTGQATFAGEFELPGLAHAWLVESSIARGRISAIETEEAEAAEGVLGIISHANAPRLAYGEPSEKPPVDPDSGHQLEVFQAPDVLFCGQPIAVVIAETAVQAQHAASLVRVRYSIDAADLHFDAGRGRPPSKASAEYRRGDPDGAMAGAPVRIDARYLQPREHHNAIEPHVTIASWDGERLTLYDKTQWVGNDRSEIARVFGIPEENIRVISPFVGGAFGSGLRTWPHVTIAAIAARHVGRPVRLELTRRQLYHAVGFRPHTEQKLALGAERDGRLTGLILEAVGQTSTYEDYTEKTVGPAALTYACENLRTAYRLVEMNTNTPCPMRAPGVATGVLALEIAMDELAVELGMDPIELRLRNHAERDPRKDRPWSSKALRECYFLAAERFGWADRPRTPGSMREGRDLLGWGMATAVYPAERSAAKAAATLFANGTALVRSAASDMGPGTYTAMTQVAADALGLPLERLRFELGDTQMPEAPVHGGSITMASVGNAVRAACEALKAKLRELGDGEEVSGDIGELLRRHGLDRLEAEGGAQPGEETRTHTSYSFGAVFAEVRVDPDFWTVRVPRLVGAYDIGRVVNPKIAGSQCVGGMVGGLGMALLEEAEWDPRFGKVMNANLAEYLVPVNADVAEVHADFVESEDLIFNPLGTKGVAELGYCGVASAIANAVWHATGRRVREFPITPERLLRA
jgi:xanthine dehydrogenase YagR molybdenum-binding subunit